MHYLGADRKLAKLDGLRELVLLPHLPFVLVFEGMLSVLLHLSKYLLLGAL